MKKKIHLRQSAARGVTLIELLVTVGLVAVVTLSILSLIRSSVRMISVSQNMVLAAQMAITPALHEKGPVHLRQTRAEDLEMGPMRLQSVVMEMVKDGRDEGIQVRIYR